MAILDMYFLLPSVCGVPSVLVEAERLSEGIMVVLMALTLADRARDALVGVETALGKPPGIAFACETSSSSLRSWGRGRVLEASSSWLRLTRFPGVAEGSLGAGNTLKDLERGKLEGAQHSDFSKPALELLRLSEDDVVGAVTEL